MVRYAILADIHANLPALQAVLRDIEARGGVDQLWCLGDVVGYGPDPHECLELLRSYDHICVAGNHDWAAIGRIDTRDFNPDAATAARWTAQKITAEDIDYLAGLPLTLAADGFTLVHGSPKDPIWEYLFSTAAALDSFSYFETPCCLVGHSHTPLVFALEPDEGFCHACSLPAGASLEIDSRRTILNPGGVGQPRDGDPRSSYALYDSATRFLHHFRVAYDVGCTQRRMAALGLPHSLSARLSRGL